MKLPTPEREAKEKAAERKNVFKQVKAGLEAEHAEVFTRRSEIERRKQVQMHSFTLVHSRHNTGAGEGHTGA